MLNVGEMFVSLGLKRIAIIKLFIACIIISISGIVFFTLSCLGYAATRLYFEYLTSIEFKPWIIAIIVVLATEVFLSRYSFRKKSQKTKIDTEKFLFLLIFVIVPVIVINIFLFSMFKYQYNILSGIKIFAPGDEWVGYSLAFASAAFSGVLFTEKYGKSLANSSDSDPESESTVGY